MNVYKAVRDLVDYGLYCGLIRREDAIYSRNRILWLLKLNEYEEPTEERLSFSEEDKGDKLELILKELLEYAISSGIIENSITDKDIFDTKLMNCMMPMPHEVIDTFNKHYEASPKEATDYFYDISRDSDYIRRYRIKKDLRWKTDTAYGELDITINLSKPEKDPKAIAAAKKMKQSGYPKCQLCVENVGYAGRADHPARDNHRIIPLKLDGADWGFQYSPYVYYNEHCIVFNYEHTPMKISDATFRRLFDFIKLFPHYFLGSNADLPIVGGSILTHDHFQGGNYEFAMARAKTEAEYEPPKEAMAMDGSFTAEIVRWPMSVIRLRAKDTEVLVSEASRILAAWRAYTDEEAMIFAETDGEPHNTITPIARFKDGKYELDLVLRNNLTTEEYPLGIYHPHKELHHIKKENIGLIEVMGLAVLPARLKTEMAALKELIEDCVPKADKSVSEDGRDYGEVLSELVEKASEEHPEIASHIPWALTWIKERGSRGERLTGDQLSDAVDEEIGRVFCKVLEDAGVYKCTEEGRKYFDRFLSSVGYVKR
ncbi:MAG TPA: UDP-glucose--hexose-1-phosphate uridylyltransferase [Candidatus Avilachnospira avistercoris]|nr:UDP-glucose--hexose-1-phosphate uridylyltransferase [Candidatus Avilachnospira avistercoris]